MKKILLISIMFVGLASGPFAANSDFHLEAGALYGSRSIADSGLKSIYGEGLVYFPYAGITWKGVLIGGGYEGGYSKSGTIGLYEEASSLKISGFEFFIGYVIRIKIIAPYIKLGYGSYSYQQKVDSPYVESFKVDHKKTAVSIGGGIRLYPFKNLLLMGEAKYVPLKVMPFDVEVDLSGLRLLAGIGLSI
ncbi:MAG: outer membrane beta-barrel protein [Clostridiales bacterium]|nr:outer membrane beta-barrel protein [Clostridiales bacterium]